MKVVVSVAGERVTVASVVQPGDYCVGRHGGSSLHLAHPTVSGRHARLRWDGEALLVLDESADERSWINGTRLKGWSRWRPGDELRLGAVTMELVAERGSAGLPATTLKPNTTPLTHDPSLAATAPFAALVPPEARRRQRRVYATSSASLAAFVAAWVALFW
jgi:predicted component of type VI protein secretion system